MISVIVPVYKVEKYLRDCVRSIQTQTYKDLEIILVDDGSPDNCGKICDELALEDSRIKVIHQNNGGLAIARNSGLDYAINGSLTNKKNHYIAFIDSDDTIECRMFETMVEMMKENSDLAICGHRIVLENISPESIAIKKEYEKLSNKELWEEIFGRLNNAAWNKLYKAELIGNLRFPVGIIHGEDLIFNLNYISSCKEGTINRTPFYNYLKRVDSITTGTFTRKKLMEITSKELAKEIVEKQFPELLPQAELYCFRARMNVLRGIYKSGQQTEYYKEINSYDSYIKQNFERVRKLLRRKERIEYYIYKSSKLFYRLIVKLAFS